MSESEIIGPESFITLHYRVVLEDGTEVVSTYDMYPATIQMGAGHLSTNLEKCLIGLMPGDERHEDLSPEEGFGAYNPMLTQTVSRQMIPTGTPLVIGEPVHLVSDNGIPYAGLLRAMDEEEVTIDFNHPLAGRTIHFDAKIIGVMPPIEE